MKLFSVIEGCFPLIERLFTKDEFDEFIACDYQNMHKYHLSLGMWIRNNLLNSGGQPEKLFIKGGLENKDDMSSLIINLFYIYAKTTLQCENKKASPAQEKP